MGFNFQKAKSKIYFDIFTTFWDRLQLLIVSLSYDELPTVVFITAIKAVLDSIASFLAVQDSSIGDLVSQ